MTQWLFALPAVLWAAQIAPTDAHAQTRAGPIAIADAVQLQSVRLKETRTLLISKPTGYDKGTDRYPVLYLLDGEPHFRYTAAIADFLAANDRIPKMLVVGIASGDSRKRTHDLTPPSTSETDNRFSPGNGGAGAFLSFLESELIPYVDQNYRTRPYRLLAGHSFGGLFAIYALTTRPKLFNGYIVADPSVYWNNQAVVAQAEASLAHTASLPADFYMTAAGVSSPVPDEMARWIAALTTISLLVAALLSAGRLEDASKVLLHDTAAYPPPWNQLDALARAYEKRGDGGQAVRYYRLSLAQNPGNDFARKKLTDLRLPGSGATAEFAVTISPATCPR